MSEPLITHIADLLPDTASMEPSHMGTDPTVEEEFISAFDPACGWTWRGPTSLAQAYVDKHNSLNTLT